MDQDCENEGPHYGLRKNLRAAKRGTPLPLKDSFAVPTDLNFAARLTQVLVLLILGYILSFLFVCLRLKIEIFC